MISVMLPGVAAERGEDPVVDGSHGGEEGGSIEDKDNDEYHEGGGGGGGGTAKSLLPSPPLMPPEPCQCLHCSRPIGNDDGVHHLPEVRQHK
jgi:hypothetical protein